LSYFSIFQFVSY